jgi:hypothetical protein
MKLERVLLTSVVSMGLAVASCSDAAESSDGGNGGSLGIGGTASGGSSSGGAGTAGSTSGTGGAGMGGSAGVGTGGSAATGGAGNGGSSSGAAGMGGSMAGTGGAGATVGSAGTGGTGAAGAGTGGTGASGTGGSGGSTGGRSAEDDGTDCQVPALPESGSLPTVARLPDPFMKLDGMRMTTRAEWRCRRQEIKKQAEKYAYGTKPPKPATVSGTVSNSSISVMVSEGGRSASFSASVSLPSGGAGPYPAVVVLGGFGADTNTIRSEGVATINYDPYALGREGTGRANKQGAFYTLYGSNSTTGLLVAWAWGVSRIIDVIEQSGGNVLKADAIGVTGCSRFGKGAFTVGVFDQRIALTLPIESGTAGVPIWRGVPGEGAQSLSSAYGEQPWFGDAFSAFTGTPTRAPLDTHALVAMIAPRGLFIMDNPHIANLGPRSAHVAALAGEEVYKALGAGANISYISAVASGSHCATRPEWTEPLRRNLRKFLLKTVNDAGVISASGNASGNLSEWRDWTTPSLN